MLCGHPLPPRPVVRGAVTPNVERVRYAAAGEGFRKAAVLLEEEVVFPHGESEPSRAAVVQARAVPELRNVVGWVLFESLIVEVPVQEAADIKGPAKRERTAEQLRVAKHEIHSVVAAETGTDGAEDPSRVLAAHERDDFPEDITLVRRLETDAGGRCALLVVPTHSVDGVEAEQLQRAVVEGRAQDVDHAAVREFGVPSAGGGKDEERLAGVAVDGDLHVLPENAAPADDVLLDQIGITPRSRSGAYVLVCPTWSGAGNVSRGSQTSGNVGSAIRLRGNRWWHWGGVPPGPHVDHRKLHHRGEADAGDVDGVYIELAHPAYSTERG